MSVLLVFHGRKIIKMYAYERHHAETEREGFPFNTNCVKTATLTHNEEECLQEIQLHKNQQVSSDMKWLGLLY